MEREDLFRQWREAEVDARRAYWNVFAKACQLDGPIPPHEIRDAAALQMKSQEALQKYLQHVASRVALGDGGGGGASRGAAEACAVLSPDRS